MRRTASLPLPLLLTALLLAGCTDPSPMPTPPPTPSQTPIFASDEEALAAAEEAYGKYIATVDAILADGGADAQRLKPLASTELYDVQKEGFDSFAAKGWRAIGSTELRNFTLQNYEGRLVTLYVCTDISNVDVVDAEGTSQVTENRTSENAHEATLESIEGNLVVTADEQWSGGGVC